MGETVVTQAKQEQVTPGLERVPGWDSFPWLRAGFSTRLGGHSQAYGAGEQNLGWTAEDHPEVVRAARRRFASGVGQGDPLPLVTVQQEHGAVVRDLDQEPAPWMTDEGKARMEGDGLISLTPGRLLAILTADCVPVLIADTHTHAVGAFHAGWRGTLAHIVQHGIAGMQSRYGSQPEHMMAAIGPCIAACCFQVGNEVREAFLQGDAGSASLFTDGENGLYMDLVAANHRQLMEGGIAKDRIHVMGECTACTRTLDGRRKYFSYRSERGKTGRMLSGIAAPA